MQQMTAMAILLSFFHTHLHTLILGVHVDVQIVGFFSKNYKSKLS